MISSMNTKDSNGEATGNPSMGIGMLGFKLLTKAALCAATVALIAGMAAVLFSRAG